MLIAIFGVSAASVPTIEELSLMPVTSQWLPIDNSFEKQLVEMLVRDGRSFVKGLRYNMRPGQLLASAILIDAGDSPKGLFIAPRVDDDESAFAVKDFAATNGLPAWVWRTAEGAMPALPARRRALATAPTTAYI